MKWLFLLIFLQREKLIHELGHLVGLWHEHARFDRDSNVIILWSNVGQEKERNFVKMPFMQLLSPYDLSSIMHYDMKVRNYISIAFFQCPLPT